MSGFNLFCDSPKVYNKKDPKAQGIWIDRDTEWGNPYHIDENNNRKKVISKYEKRLIADPQKAGRLHLLRGKSLICHCKPKACHGDVLFKYANGFWVCVTGGRDFTDRKSVYDNLDRLNKEKPIRLLIEGEARGLDTLAKEWAISRKIPYAACSADWSKGKKAGLLRNTYMLETYNPDLLLVFPGNEGTKHCYEEARELGIPCKRAKILRG